MASHNQWGSAIAPCSASNELPARIAPVQFHGCPVRHDISFRLNNRNPGHTLFS